MHASMLFNHPVETMVVNLLFTLPVLFVAFTLAARAQTAGASGRHGTIGKVACVLGVAFLFATAVWIDRAFVGPYYLLDGSAYALSDPMAVLLPFAMAVLIVPIRNNWLRAGLALAGTAVDLLLIDGFPSASVFTVLDPRQWGYMLLAVTVGSGLMAIGIFHVSSPSYVSRGVGALSAAWGMKLLTYAMMSAHRPATSIFTVSSGVLSPGLLVWFTIMLLGAAAVAFAEHRRLQSSAYRQTIVRDSERRMRVLAEASREAILVVRDGVVQDANAVFRRLVRMESPMGEPITRWLPAGGSERRRQDDTLERGDRTCLLHGPNDSRIPIELHTTDMGDGRTVYSIRDLTETQANEERIRYLADNDALTGIANRRFFDEALKRAVRMATDGMPPNPTTPKLALIMCDLDRFKPVNDTYGHAMGDALLKEVARRFREAIRPADVLARIGGDEFSLVAWVSDAEGAKRLADRLCRAALTPFAIEGRTISIGASAGLAILDGEREADSVETLQQSADIALYRAKDKGRGHAIAFHSDMRAEARDRLEIEEDLRHALSRSEILLHYQPQHDVRSGQVIGYEALMRWNHPVRGMIPPSVFIPLAEETGVIVQLGRWALGRAMTDFVAFDDTLRVSINVSPLQFTSSDLFADVERALNSTGFDPTRLELEVTEQLLLDDSVATLRTLERLEALGIALSLDDFGTGYASLGYLTRFPFSKIKIDRSFIDAMMTDERARKLVHSMMALAASLDLRVTAEGVETHGQLLQLAQHSCDEAQGFLLGRPEAMCDLRARHNLPPIDPPFRMTA